MEAHLAGQVGIEPTFFLFRRQVPSPLGDWPETRNKLLYYNTNFEGLCSAVGKVQLPKYSYLGFSSSETGDSLDVARRTRSRLWGT